MADHGLPGDELQRQRMSLLPPSVNDSEDTDLEAQSLSSKSIGTVQSSKGKLQSLNEKRHQILKYVPFLRYSHSQELYATGERRKNAFRLTNCFGCLIMVFFISLIGTAIVGKFSSIGTKIQLQYEGTTIGFEKPIQITTDSFKPVMFTFITDAYKVMNKDFFATAKDRQGDPYDVSTEEKYWEAICDLVRAEIAIDFATAEWCSIPMNCSVVSGSSFDNALLVYLGQTDDLFEYFWNDEVIEVHTREYPPLFDASTRFCEEGFIVNENQAVNSTFIYRFFQGFETLLSSYELIFIEGRDYDPVVQFYNDTTTYAPTQVSSWFDVERVIEEKKIQEYEGFFGWVGSMITRMNPFSDREVIHDKLIFSKTTELGRSKNQHVEGVKAFSSAQIELLVNYPPVSIVHVTYYSIQDFLAEIGGFLSIAKFAVAILTGFVIFKELNRHMARRILERQEFDGTGPERKEKLNEIEAKFRESVSLEGIYEARLLIEKQQKQIEDLQRKVEELSSKQ